jgi:5-methylcytosine-specific restriction endonuclease McrA
MGACGTTAGYKTHRRHSEAVCDACREAVRLAAQEWRKNNPEKKREQTVAWQRANPEKASAIRKASYYRHLESNRERAREQMRKHYAENPGNRVEYDREYRKQNPHVAREANRRRRAREALAENSPYTEAEVLTAWGSTCHICSEEIDFDAPRRAGSGPGWGRGLHLDHVIPLSRGGADTLDNVKPAHAICNSKKHTRTDYAHSL